MTSAPITVPTNSLLLGWVKNESDATATALDGYTLDAQSTSFLWAESQTALTASSYTGNFQYDTAIGWQTAIVGLQPAPRRPAHAGDYLDAGQPDEPDQRQLQLHRH